MQGTSGPGPAGAGRGSDTEMGGRQMTRGGRMDENSPGGREVVISSPEELIASIPAMLGFPPGPGSVVVMCGRTGDGGQGPVVRMDVDALLDEDLVAEFEDEIIDDPEVDLDEVAERALWHRRSRSRLGPAQGLARFCDREGVTEVHLVVVHEDCAGAYEPGLRAEDVAAEFEYCLGAVGTKVMSAYGVGGFAAGEPWVDLFGMIRGVQVDPDSTQIAAVHAFGGRVRAGSRDEIDELYRSRDADACAVDPGGTGADDAGDTGTGPGLAAPAATVECAVEAHGDAVRRLEVGEEIDDDELAVIGRTLLVTAVRDEIYRLLAVRGLGEGDGRRELWWAIARRRPGRERSVALLLLGAAAYFSGSGVHAWSALAAALDADPGNSLARLLLEGLTRGLAPERLRRVAEVA